MDKTFIGCADVNFRPGRPLNFKPEAIVIHIAVGSLKSVDAHFNDPNAQVSAHYCVAKTGVVHQYVHETDTAFHAGIVVNPTWPLLKTGVNPNFYTIGIEHEGLPDDVWPDVQIDTSAALVGEIAHRWGILLDDLHVIRHHQIRASKTCPGSFITIAKILERVPPATEGTTSRMVRTITKLNLRAGKPSVNALVVRTIPANTNVSVSASVLGDKVNGNPAWFSDGNGNFFWAGGTDNPNPTQ
jgi:N-acetyl-anhydromuramyl-L-alanine amidase AmpD